MESSLSRRLLLLPCSVSSLKFSPASIAGRTILKEVSKSIRTAIGATLLFCIGVNIAKSLKRELAIEVLGNDHEGPYSDVEKRNEIQHIEAAIDARERELTNAKE
jgi:hypothetical protein